MDAILTPMEMEALLKPAVAPSQQVSVKPIDLVSRDHRAFALLPEIQEAADRLAIQLGRICTHQLKTACKTTVDPVEVLPGARLIDLLGTPRFSYGLNVGTYLGAGLLTLDAVLGGFFVERQFGGDLESLPALEKPPTNTENRTVARLAEIFLSVLTKAMSTVTHLEVQLEQGTPSLIKNSAKAVAVLLMVFRMSIGEHRCTINIALDTGAAGFKLSEREDLPGSRPAGPGPLSPLLGKVSLWVSAVLGTAFVPVHQFLSLREGDLIVLDSPLDAEVPLLVEGKAKFSGSPAIHRGSLSIQISQRIKE